MEARVKERLTGAVVLVAIVVIVVPELLSGPKHRVPPPAGSHTVKIDLNGPHRLTPAAPAAAAAETGVAAVPADGGALLLIDLDHFKQTNDRFGHAAGDEVLVAFAHYVQSTLRPHDAFARIGGEEFVLYLPAVAAAEAMQVAERLRSGIADLVCVSVERRIPLTASIGVAVANPTDRDWKTTLHRADQALYDAKAAGRNRVELHHPSVPVHGLAS